MRVGVLTGGGDAPGLNAVLRAMVRRGTDYGMAFVGFRDAWRGRDGRDVMPLDISKVRGILPRGGTILGTSRANPYLVDGGVDAVRGHASTSSSSTGWSSSGARHPRVAPALSEDRASTSSASPRRSTTTSW